eukprot:NODE_14516_length_420_cov_27.337884_g14493_i0.p1 GENE.NODE_14516_length_420_cov_27.337884_g14493_i0~~NODE_14516_length_420_cov_27.337884_g14493_i0.p1  ORF type:complete len:119 (-),score=23.45 NODE_14516_length_420_cov_27.337884_g14493_i0:64-375(-)
MAALDFAREVRTDRAQQIIRRCTDKITYSDKYTDDTHEYRHVHLPKELSKLLPRTRLLSEEEWRSIGVQQSYGWEHYMVHRPEPHVMLFRRAVGYQPPSRVRA